MHYIAAITGAIGALALVAKWVAGPEGLFWGQNEAHLFNDAQTLLLLLSISAGVGALIHLKEEGR